MVKISATDRSGTTHALQGPPGKRVMELLRNLNEGVEGLCGGEPNCATCHVYVDPATRAKLPPASAYEIELLECLDSYRDDQSRLSCQIKLSEDMDSVHFTVVDD